MVVCCMPNGCGPRGFMLRSRTTDYRALERACEVRPSLVVTDLDIPGIDGFELTRRLKRDSRTRDVPVIAVTGLAAFGAEPDRARGTGYDTVLHKPCGADDLYSSINDPMRERAENR